MNSVEKVVLSIHIMQFFISAFFLVCIYLKKKLPIINIAFLKVLHIVLITTVLSLCSSAAVCSKFIGQQPFSYVVALFTIASMVVVTPGKGFIIYALSFLIYITGILKFHLIISSDILFIFLLLILSLIILQSNYLAFVRNFINRTRSTE